jgi:hypothetical protein
MFSKGLNLRPIGVRERGYEDGGDWVFLRIIFLSILEEAPFTT